MSPANLIEIATRLTLASRDTPEHQENLGRAVSTAYYAMFHTAIWNLMKSVIFMGGE